METIDPPNDDDGNGKDRPFDPRKLRLSQRFSEGIDARRILTQCRSGSRTGKNS